MAHCAATEQVGAAETKAGMNAEIQLTRSLKANGFVLARQDKHKIYRRDDDKETAA